MPEAVRWVEMHLGHLVSDDVRPSGRFRGGQRSADEALAAYDVAGYAAQRNEVWPLDRRGASQLSPYIRYNLLTLERVWNHVEGGPPPDVAKLHDELMWQEYARHLYARLGIATRSWIRFAVEVDTVWNRPAWDREMACLDLAVTELLADGWLVNQARMWLSAQWTLREGRDWRAGEDAFFRQLLDGSRAANRAGWLWTAGGATGKPYGFGRWQVERRAPGLCATCALNDECPIGASSPIPEITHLREPGSLRGDPDPRVTAGPASVESSGEPEAVWMTAESMGTSDAAMAGRPDLPVVFVFDESLLMSLQLSGKRLVFLTETLAELATHRTVEIHLGRPVDVLRHRPVAVTFAPVPGFRRLARVIEPVELHPYPWLRRPSGGSVASYSQWRKMH